MRFWWSECVRGKWWAFHHPHPSSPAPHSDIPSVTPVKSQKPIVTESDKTMNIQYTNVYHKQYRYLFYHMNKKNWNRYWTDFFNLWVITEIDTLTAECRIRYLQQSRKEQPTPTLYQKNKTVLIYRPLTSASGIRMVTPWGCITYLTVELYRGFSGQLVTG